MADLRNNNNNPKKNSRRKKQKINNKVYFRMSHFFSRCSVDIFCKNVEHSHLVWASHIRMHFLVSLIRKHISRSDFACVPAPLMVLCWRSKYARTNHFHKTFVKYSREKTFASVFFFSLRISPLYSSLNVYTINRLNASWHIHIYTIHINGRFFFLHRSLDCFAFAFNFTSLLCSLFHWAIWRTFLLLKFCS